MKRHTMIAATILLSLSAFHTGAQPAAQAVDAGLAKTAPDVWMCHKNGKEVALNAAQCPTVAAKLGILQIFIVSLYAEKPDHFTDEELRAIARFCIQRRLPISIECGGTLQYASLDENEGESSAALELPGFRRLVQAGVRPSIINMDDPVSRSMLLDDGDRIRFHKGLATVDEATREMIDYMRAVRKEIPDVQFVYVTNFLNWGWKGQPCFWARPQKPLGRGDFHPVIQAVVKATREAGIPLRGVLVDAPYDYVTGHHPDSHLPDPTKADFMGRVRDLEDYVHSQGLEFTLTINSETPGSANDDKKYYEDTLAYMDAYRGRGGRPDHWLVESWYPGPQKVVPESEPYTFSYLVKAVIEKTEAGR
ncbi:MAG: hypothetical protein M1457_07885 [bacterium]|nr:hypothetical protein [bacterium]